MSPMTFVFPMPTNLTNQRKHWRAVASQKSKYRAVLDAMQNVGALPPPPAQPFASVTVSSVMRLGHAMDDDNALARHKWCLDWLKTRGYIVDDRRQVMRWEGMPEQIVGRKQDYTITLTLTPLDVLHDAQRSA